MLQKVDVAFTFCNMEICCVRRWQYAQQTISTCSATNHLNLQRNKPSQLSAQQTILNLQLNKPFSTCSATLLRDNLREKCCPYYWDLIKAQKISAFCDSALVQLTRQLTQHTRSTERHQAIIIPQGTLKIRGNKKVLFPKCYYDKNTSSFFFLEILKVCLLNTRLAKCKLSYLSKGFLL